MHEEVNNHNHVNRGSQQTRSLITNVPLWNSYLQWLGGITWLALASELWMEMAWHFWTVTLVAGTRPTELSWLCHGYWQFSKWWVLAPPGSYCMLDMQYEWGINLCCFDTIKVWGLFITVAKPSLFLANRYSVPMSSSGPTELKRPRKLFSRIAQWNFLQWWKCCICSVQYNNH